MKIFKPIITTALMISISASMFNILQAEEKKIVLTLNDPIMSVNGEQTEIDRGMGTTPVISDGRTLVPIRAIIEAFGGNAEWDPQTSTATVTHRKNNIKLTIGSKTAYINDSEKNLDTSPIIIYS